MNFLLDEEISEAQQLFVLVTTVRTAKVGLCISDEQDTRNSAGDCGQRYLGTCSIIDA